MADRAGVLLQLLRGRARHRASLRSSFRSIGAWSEWVTSPHDSRRALSLSMHQGLQTQQMPLSGAPNCETQDPVSEVTSHGARMKATTEAPPLQPHRLSFWIALLEQTAKVRIAGPGGPVTPCGPWGPSGPVAPCVPWGPGGPVTPCVPWGPSGPVTPCVPCGPGGPAGPAGVKAKCAKPDEVTAVRAPISTSGF